MIVAALANAQSVVRAKLLHLGGARVTSLHTLVRGPTRALEESLAVGLPILHGACDSIQFKLQLGVFCLELAPLQQNLVSIFNSRIYQVETCVGAVSLLLYYSHVLAERLLRVL